MGPYALYIWPAFAVSAVVIGWMAVDSLARARRWRRAVQALEAAEALDAGKP